MREYRYKVSGFGEFPHDMLRYDQARVLDADYSQARPWYTIQGKAKPTVGRWQSFLWVVRDIEVVND